MPVWLWYALKLFIGIGLVALTYLSAGLVVRSVYRQGTYVPPWVRFVPILVALIGFAIVALLVVPPSKSGTRTTRVDSTATTTLDTQLLTAGNDRRVFRVRRVPLPVTLLIVGFIFTGGLVMTLRFHGTPRRLGPLVSASAIALLVVEEMTLVRFEVNPQFEISIGRNTPFDLQRAGLVGPFLEATANKLSPQGGYSALTAVIDSLRARLGRKELQFVIVLGGGGKRQKQDPAQTWFGSNEGLAQARAAWLSDTLTKAVVGLDHVPVFVWSQGATKFGTSVTSLQLQEDRRVTVLMGLRRSVRR